MAVFKDPTVITQWMGSYFGLAAAPVTPAQLYVTLLDSTGSEVSSNIRERRDPGVANWASFTEAVDCNGDASTGLGTAGIQSVLAIDFGTVPPGETWSVSYISVYSDDYPGGTEIFRIPVASGPRVFTAGEGVVLPAGDLKFGSEYII